MESTRDARLEILRVGLELCVHSYTYVRVFYKFYRVHGKVLIAHTPRTQLCVQRDVALNLYRILLCNGQNIAEYETYWLMGVPIINP